MTNYYIYHIYQISTLNYVEIKDNLNLWHGTLKRII